MFNPYAHKVQYYETDGMGIVHHSNYIRWFEESRVDFMDQIGFPYARFSGLGFETPVIEVACQYKRMVRFGDTVLLRPQIKHLSISKLEIHYEITDAQTGELTTTGSSLHYFYSMERGRIVSLKKEVPELYALLEAHHAPGSEM